MKIKNTLADLFGQSPIRPLQEHMSVSASAADKLLPFLHAAISGDWQAAEAIYNEIREIEHQADELKRDLRLHLPKSLFLPVPRSDLLDLLTKQDKIANTAKDIAGLMLGRKMKIPTAMHVIFEEFVKIVIEAAHQAHEAIRELDELLESGFSGRELDTVEQLVFQLNEREREADRKEIAVRAQLYTLESEMPPVDVMFLYRIIESIGDLADRSEKVGSRLLLLIAR